jgi:rubrerythrin
MPILTPTKDQGAQTKYHEAIYAEPAQTVTDADLAALLPDVGLNMPFLADVLSAMLTHERCGRHLYRAAEARSNNPILRGKYKEFGAETERHVTILEGLITEMGGNPNYVSPTARVVEAADSRLLEATYATSGSVDPMNAEMALLDAVFIAESVDHANWQTFSVLVQELPPGDLREAAAAAAGEVEAEEDEHLGWASDMKQRLVLMQAKSSFMQTAGMKAEEMIARVKAALAD